MNAKSEHDVAQASLVIANAKVKGLEREVTELRSHIFDSCRPKEGSNGEMDVQAKSELDVAQASLVIANAKIKGLEREVTELRSHISDSSRPKEVSNGEKDIQEPPSRAGGDLLAPGVASKRRSEAPESGPQRKRMPVPSTSGQAAPGTNPQAEITLHSAAETASVERARNHPAPGIDDSTAPDTPVPGTSHQAASDAHPWGWTALHLAVKGGALDTMKELLTRGSNPREQDLQGRTPLHCALDWRKRAAAELLIENGGGNDIPCEDGWTPLHHAAAAGFVEFVRKLLAAGASTRLQTSGGATPLHVALRQGGEAAADVLVEADSENDIPNKNGETPLHFAVKEGYASIVKRLLSSGARPHVKDRWGVYPLFLALSEGRDDIVKILLAVYAWRGIEIDWADVAKPRFEVPLRPDLVQRGTDLLSECDTEIRRMKETRIGGSAVCYHDVATRDVNTVAAYLRNEGIREALLCDRATSAFPIYADLIAEKVRSAEERRLLADRCRECFSVLARKLPRLPLAIVDIVLRWLTERDMQNFVEAFHSDFENSVENKNTLMKTLRTENVSCSFSFSELSCPIFSPHCNNPHDCFILFFYAS